MSSELESKRIGFIGCGAMASALAGGLAKMGVESRQMLAADPSEEQRARFESALGLRTVTENVELVEQSDVVVLCVKPGIVPKALSDLTGKTDLSRPLWISIAAGVTVGSLESVLPAGARIIRAMPNTPALVGEGATAYFTNADTRDEEGETAEQLFSAVGLTWRTRDEEQLNAVTGLSGSGPAYVFLFLEGLIAAGIAEGLPAEAAEKLAFQTVYGAAKLALQDERDPATLRKQVSSPGGTTVAGLAELNAGGLEDLLSQAVKAATRRSRELSSEN